MNKGLIRLTACFGMLALMAAPLEAQIYKTVDEHGNVTFTDQAPADGSEPIDLPDLPVVETDYPEPAVALVEDESEATEEQGMTPRELRRTYRDFRITRPQPEETFWGTNNTVVVSWNSSTPLAGGMSVRLYVDGQIQTTSTQSMMALTLDRGTHTVAAELLDQRGRKVVTTPTVTFFVKQNSVNFNRPQATPGRN